MQSTISHYNKVSSQNCFSDNGGGAENFNSMKEFIYMTAVGVIQTHLLQYAYYKKQ
jgi:hypothetical protein